MVGYVIVKVIEDEFKEDNIAGLLDNKEGWVNMLSCLKAYLEHGITDLKFSIIK